MSLFGKNINKYIEKYRNEENITLVDVREPDEFSAGRIPGSINLPLSNLASVESALTDKTAKIYVYCRSGSRSGMAAKAMKDMGYENVTNIGGILRYRGEIDRR